MVLKNRQIQPGTIRKLSSLLSIGRKASEKTKRMFRKSGNT